MIPTTTGAAAAVSLVLPALKGKLDGLAIRVTTPNVSLVDLVAELENNVTVEEVNNALREAAEGSLSGILRYCNEELVSIDFNGSRHSSIVDALSTFVIDGTLVKVLSASKKDRTVVIASSDLYHGGSYDECKTRDAQLASALEKFNASVFMEGIEQGKYMACGAGPIAVVMLTSQGLGAKNLKILHRTNSYDANPVNDSYVVGYLAAVYY